MAMNVKPVAHLDDEVNEVRLATAEIVNEDILPVENKLWGWVSDSANAPNEVLEEARELRNQVQNKVKERKLWAPHLPPEFGGMGLEGAVKLGYRKELEAIEDPEERLAEYEKRVEQMYERGKAVNFATAFEIDEVIDPMETRQWILAGLKSAPAPAPRSGKKKPFVDTW